MRGSVWDVYSTAAGWNKGRGGVGAAGHGDANFLTTEEAAVPMGVQLCSVV